MTAALQNWVHRFSRSFAFVFCCSSCVVLAQAVDPQDQTPSKVYKIGGEISPPVVRHQVEPQYSEQGRRKRLEGAVLLGIIVDANGRPKDIRIIRALGSGLDEEAISAVRKWRFEPALKDGKPVAVRANVEVNFRFAESRDELAKVQTNQSVPDVDRLVKKQLEKSLNKGYSITSEDAAALEQQLLSAPKDIDTRIKLLAFYTSHPGASGPEPAREARARHIFWLIENAPDWTVLGHPVSSINRIGEPLADEDLFQRGKTLWKGKIESARDNTLFLIHAAHYFKAADKEQAEQLILQLINIDRKHTSLLGELYGMGVLGVTAVNLKSGTPIARDPDSQGSEFAKRALASITASSNPTLVTSAVDVITKGMRDLRSEAFPLEALQTACQQIADRANTLKLPHSVDCIGHEQPTIIRIGGDVAAANLVAQVPPQYPREAKWARVSGTVSFNAVIGTDGLVKNLTLVSGHPLLVKASLEAVRQWKYKPILLNGRAVEVVTRIDVTFSLR